MSYYTVKKGFHIEEIFGQMFLVAGKKCRKTVPVLTPLNETAYLIWHGISSGKSIYEIASKMGELYDVSPETGIEDIRLFCRKLEQGGYITFKESEHGE